MSVQKKLNAPLIPSMTLTFAEQARPTFTDAKGEHVRVDTKISDLTPASQALFKQYNFPA